MSKSVKQLLDGCMQTQYGDPYYSTEKCVEAILKYDWKVSYSLKNGLTSVCCENRNDPTDNYSFYIRTLVNLNEFKRQLRKAKLGSIYKESVKEALEYDRLMDENGFSVDKLANAIRENDLKTTFIETFNGHVNLVCESKDDSLNARTSLLISKECVEELKSIWRKQKIERLCE